MKIGITADSRLWSGLITGIEYYVDNLLAALYDSETTHMFCAFAPETTVGSVLRARAAEGLYRWLDNPRATIDLAGPTIRPAAWLWRKDAVRRLAAAAFDHRPLSSVRRRSAQMRARLFSRRFDVLHMALPTAAPVLSSRSNVATIYDLTTRLCPWAHTSWSIAFWERIFDFAKYRCARVLTISSWSKRDIVEHLGVPEDRVDVTPLAPRATVARIEDEPALHDALAPLGLFRRPFTLYAGSLEPRKNLLRLVTAFHRVVGETKLPHVLVLAGAALGDHGDDVRRHAERLQIGERVRQTGYVSNRTMNALMSACDLFVYVSEYEGFGLPPLEAMTCGAPVVSSNTTSLPEVVGEAAIQVAPGDVDAIAGAIALMLTDSDENRRRRALSAQRARMFTWAQTAHLTVRAYEAAAG